jgi:hypothetical protein
LDLPESISVHVVRTGVVEIDDRGVCRWNNVNTGCEN